MFEFGLKINSCHVTDVKTFPEKPKSIKSLVLTADVGVWREENEIIKNNHLNHDDTKICHKNPIDCNAICAVGFYGRLFVVDLSVITYQKGRSNSQTD